MAVKAYRQNEWVRPQQMAQYLSIHPSSLWKLTLDDTFPEPIKRGSVVLYNLSAVEAWFLNRAK